MHKGTSNVKWSRILKLNKDFELYIMEKDEKFDKFYTHLSNIVNILYNPQRPISEEKLIEKIIASLPHHFHVKIMLTKSMYKLEHIMN